MSSFNTGATEGDGDGSQANQSGCSAMGFADLYVVDSKAEDRIGSIIETCPPWQQQGQQQGPRPQDKSDPAPRAQRQPQHQRVQQQEAT